MARPIRFKSRNTSEMAVQLADVLGGDYDVERYTMLRGGDAEAVLVGANGKRVTLTDTPRGLLAEQDTDEESALLKALKLSVEQNTKGGDVHKAGRKKK